MDSDSEAKLTDTVVNGELDRLESLSGSYTLELADGVTLLELSLGALDLLMVKARLVTAGRLLNPLDLKVVDDIERFYSDIAECLSLGEIRMGVLHELEGREIIELIGSKLIETTFDDAVTDAEVIDNERRRALEIELDQMRELIDADKRDMSIQLASRAERIELLEEERADQTRTIATLQQRNADLQDPQAALVSVIEQKQALDANEAYFVEAKRRWLALKLTRVLNLIYRTDTA